MERVALADARGAAMRDGVPIAADVWTQLWTPTQAAGQIKNCVYQGSGGVLEFQAAPLPDQAEGMNYGIGAGADISALSAPLGRLPGTPAGHRRGCQGRERLGLISFRSRDSAASGAGRHEAGHRWWSSEQHVS